MNFNYQLSIISRAHDTRKACKDNYFMYIFAFISVKSVFESVFLWEFYMLIALFGINI